MKQKLIGLRPDQERALKKRAKAEKVKVCALIRTLIDNGLKETPCAASI